MVPLIRMKLPVHKLLNASPQRLLRASAGSPQHLKARPPNRSTCLGSLCRIAPSRNMGGQPRQRLIFLTRYLTNRNTANPPAHRMPMIAQTTLGHTTSSPYLAICLWLAVSVGCLTRSPAQPPVSCSLESAGMTRRPSQIPRQGPLDLSRANGYCWSGVANSYVWGPILLKVLKFSQRHHSRQLQTVMLDRAAFT